MKMFRQLVISALFLTVPLTTHAEQPIEHTEPTTEIMERNPAISNIAEHNPEKANAIIQELQALLDIDDDDFDAQHAYIDTLSNEDKAMLEKNPLIMDVYEHNPHGMAELLKRIRDAGR